MFGPRDDHENIQSTEPPAAHQKGQPVNVKHYDSSEVLDLIQKPKTTSSTVSAAENTGNPDGTIIYEIPDEQDVEVEVQQQEEHQQDHESTEVGRGKYFPMYFFDNIQPEISQKI